MNAVFFPFTCISADIANAIYRRLGCFTVYQPVSGQTPPEMNQLSDKGIIEIRCPARGEEARLADLCRAYRQWGDLHQQNAAALERRMRLWNAADMRPSRIRSEILTNAREDPSQTDDPLFDARLFLQMAQTYDIQQIELARDLASSALDEERLFEALTGGDTGDDLPTAKRSGHDGEMEDTGVHLTKARIAAWRALAGTDTQPSNVYVTHSRAVMSLFADGLDEAGHGLTVNGLPQSIAAGENSGDLTSPWMKQLLRLTTGQQANDGEGGPAFTPAEGMPDDGYQLELTYIPAPQHPAAADAFPLPVPYRDRDKPDSNQIVIAMLVPRI